MIKPRLGIVYFTEHGIEIEIDGDFDDFKEIAAVTGGRVTWLKRDMKVVIVDSAKVVFKSLASTLETIDEYCLERR